MALIFVGKPDVDPAYFLEENRQQTTSPEDEIAAYDGYDQFLFFGKKKKRTTEEKAAKKQKRKDFWNNLGSNVKEGGGAEGLGKTVDNILNLFSKKEEVPTDYNIELAPPETETQKQGVPASMYIMGGLVLLGMAGLGYAFYQNNKKT